jgi:hypothetical protein
VPRHLDGVVGQYTPGLFVGQVDGGPHGRSQPLGIGLGAEGGQGVLQHRDANCLTLDVSGR